MVVQGTPRDRVFWLDFDSSSIEDRTIHDEHAEMLFRQESEEIACIAKALSADAKTGKVARGLRNEAEVTESSPVAFEIFPVLAASSILAIFSLILGHANSPRDEQDAGASLQGRPTTGRLGVHDDADRGHARGFRKLFRKLQASLNAQAGRLRVWDFDYDWRLSPPAAVRPPPGVPRQAAVEPGGLVGPWRAGPRAQPRRTHHPARVHEHPRAAAQRRRSAVHQKLLTARVNFFFRTSFALPPEYSFCFVDEHTGEPYPVDFLDAMSWVCHRLCPFLEMPLLPLPPLRGKTFSLTPGE
ncbi:hypothetical protein MY5147_005254 [Beauveria neobassiana]